MKKVKFGELFDFLPKSKIKAGEGRESGKYPFFKSGKDQSKRIDIAIFEGESLIVGDGGEANILYYNGKFSASDHCYVIQKKSQDVYVKYVYFFLKANMHILQEGFKGAGIKNISKKYLLNIKVPLPDTLEEQRKIANILTQVEELIEKRNESIGLLDELLKSTFLDMFGDPVINPKGWEVKPLKKFGNISTGNTPSRREEKYYNDNYIEWIKTDNILTNKMYLTKAKEYLSKEGLEKGRSVDAGALLVTCIAGSLKSIGNASLTNRKVAFNQQINAIEPFDDVSSLFLYWLVRISKNYIQDQAGKGMKKMITKSSFEKIKLPKPDYDLQDEFAKVVRQVDTIKEYYQESLDELKELFRSLSQKAFKGELDLSKMPPVKVPETSGDTEKEEPLHTERQKVEHIQGRAKSGAGEFHDEEVEIPDYMRKPVEDALHMVKKSIDTESFRSMIAQHQKQMKTLALGETMRQMEETANLFKTLHIPNFKIDIPPLFSKVSSFPSLNLDSMGIFKTAKQLMESMQKRKEHILQMLEEIPQIRKAMEEGVLCKDDFMNVTLKFDYEYADIKRIVMDKLSSGEIVQRFDEEKKTMKLVKAR